MHKRAALKSGGPTRGSSQRAFCHKVSRSDNLSTTVPRTAERYDALNTGSWLAKCRKSRKVTRNFRFQEKLGAFFARNFGL